MALKRHHKWIIGGSGTIILIFMVVISVFVYGMSIRQELQYTSLEKQVNDLKLETQANINSLSEGLIQTKGELGVIGEEFDLLRASAGEDFSGIIDSSVPAVVTIRTDISQGTGFIIDNEGYVITNAHVLLGASAAGILTYDGEIHTVTRIGENTLLDLALLKIEGNYQDLEFEDSNNIEVGESVIAIGNPLGLQFSVSQGIVSAIHRAGPNGIEAYIQTDAPLNPGNSGGPLINKQGKVIGINNFKVGGSEGLGFALESNFIIEVINDIYFQANGEELI